QSYNFFFFTVHSHSATTIDLNKGCILTRYSNPYSRKSFTDQLLMNSDGTQLMACSLEQIFSFKKPD
ncbi:MAG TPA: hypothetical protein PK971_16190, partial [Saprospiraceae bacterium]|nr:hypothetical protein [Saprospiraceae bacterium]